MCIKDDHPVKQKEELPQGVPHPDALYRRVPRGPQGRLATGSQAPPHWWPRRCRSHRRQWHTRHRLANQDRRLSWGQVASGVMSGVRAVPQGLGTNRNSADTRACSQKVPNLSSDVPHVTRIPENLSTWEATSFLCAGVPVNRAVKYSQTNPGDWIVIPGAGCGIGHVAIQYAVQAFELRVLAVDTEAERPMLRARSVEVGRLPRDEKPVQDMKDAAGGGANAVLVSASSSAYEQAIDYLRPGGSPFVVGLPAASNAPPS